MKRFMLDTNTVSYLVRGQPSAIGNLVRVSTSSCCVSSLTEGELRFGLARRSAATKLGPVEIQDSHCWRIVIHA